MKHRLNIQDQLYVSMLTFCLSLVLLSTPSPIDTTGNVKSVLYFSLKSSGQLSLLLSLLSDRQRHLV